MAQRSAENGCARTREKLEDVARALELRQVAGDWNGSVRVIAGRWPGSRAMKGMVRQRLFSAKKRGAVCFYVPFPLSRLQACRLVRSLSYLIKCVCLAYSPNV
jgi:hypothetical protein